MIRHIRASPGRGSPAQFPMRFLLHRARAAMSRNTARFGTFGLFGLAAIGVIQFALPLRRAPNAPFAADEARTMRAGASLNAFGASNELKVRFALPSAT